MKLTPTLLLLSVYTGAACTGLRSYESIPEDDDDDDDESCSAIGYELEARAVALPAAAFTAGSYAFAASSAAGTTRTCADGTSATVSHQLRDMSGDGAADLLVFVNGCEDPQLGVTSWRLYPGGGDLDEPTDLRLPELGIAPSSVALSWSSVSTTPTCADATSASLVTDLVEMTGDDRPDLLVTTNGCDDEAIGITGWRVYAGAADGFEAGAPWPLPNLGVSASARPFGASSASTSVTCADGSSTGTLRFSLLDWDGDEASDLLVTTNGCEDATLGDTAWKLYRNNGAGFDAAEAIALPNLGLAPGASAMGSTSASTTASCADGSSATLRASLTDATGDGLPDLLVTQNGCLDASLGVNTWRVYAGDGAAFGEASVWTLPAAGVATDSYAFAAASQSVDATCSDGVNSGSWSHQLTDVSGDGTPDLLVTRDTCADATLGVTSWRVHVGDGAGFGEAEAWALPPTGIAASNQPFAATTTSSSVSCSNGTSGTWAVLPQDMDGDGALDLLVTRNDCADTTIGETIWQVFDAECG